MPEYAVEQNESRRKIMELVLEAHLLPRSAIVGAAEVLIRDGVNTCEAVNKLEQRLDELDSQCR
jgi:hypothetical protein